jgi:hypothetical protein
LTAKEKAKELVQRFSKLEKGLDEQEWFKREVSFNSHNQQCALICIDEKIKTAIDLNGEMFSGFIEGLQEIKQEINK